MKRAWLVLAAMVALVGCSRDKADDYVFRKVKWGMTFEQVMASEEFQRDSKLKDKSEFEDGDKTGILKYEMYIYDSMVNVEYCILDGRDGLFKIVLYISPPAFDKSDPAEIETELNRLITKKYNMKPLEAKHGEGATGITYVWALKTKNIALHRRTDGIIWLCIRTEPFVFLPEEQEKDVKIMDNL